MSVCTVCVCVCIGVVALVVDLLQLNSSKRKSSAATAAASVLLLRLQRRLFWEAAAATHALLLPSMPPQQLLLLLLPLFVLLFGFLIFYPLFLLPFSPCQPCLTASSTCNNSNRSQVTHGLSPNLSPSSSSALSLCLAHVYELSLPIS